RNMNPAMITFISGNDPVLGVVVMPCTPLSGALATTVTGGMFGVEATVAVLVRVTPLMVLLVVPGAVIFAVKLTSPLVPAAMVANVHSYTPVESSFGTAPSLAWKEFAVP